MRIQFLDYQCVGYLSYRLYSLGWRSSLHKRPPLIQHLLLSLFLYYRRGFVEGSDWMRKCYLESNSY
jgi:hypothetical protein